MEKEELAIIIRDLAKSMGFDIDGQPDYFGRCASDKIAGFVLGGWSADDNPFIEMRRKMVYIDAIRGRENISITFPARIAQGQRSAEIPGNLISDAAREAIVEGIYQSMRNELFNLVCGKAQERMMKGGRLYDCPPLWEAARQSLDAKIGNYKGIGHDMSKRQKLAVHYIWNFLPKDNEGRPLIGVTNALALCYDILESGGLITGKPDALKPTNREKRDYLKQYIPK